MPGRPLVLWGLWCFVRSANPGTSQLSTNGSVIYQWGLNKFYILCLCRTGTRPDGQGTSPGLAFSFCFILTANAMLATMTGSH
jgi:hypothetical protein